MDYNEFLRKKQATNHSCGHKCKINLSPAFDYQRESVKWATMKGKAALFHECGMGKTIQQLLWANSVNSETKKPVLILAPLSVSSQTVGEGNNFGIKVNKITCQDEISNGINITNYEKLDRFDCSVFGGIVLDECFVKNTPIDVLSIDGEIKTKYIQNLNIGDKILNAYGVDEIEDTYKRQVNRAVQISYNGRKITCS